MSESRRPKLPKPPRPPRPKDLARSLRKREGNNSEAATEPAPTGPVFRRAQSRDIAPVLALRAIMFTAKGAKTEDVSDNEWQSHARRWLQVNLANPKVNVTVAEFNGSAVACAWGEVTERAPSPANPRGIVGVLSNVATFPEYRMTGLGQGCVDAVMEWFRDETEVTSVELFATPDGRRRYLPHGFAEHQFPQMRVHLERPGPFD